jgi:hypothetical protein
MALEAEPAYRHVENVFGPLQDAPSGRIALVKLAAHARPLYALARKEQCDRRGRLDPVQVVREPPH